MLQFRRPYNVVKMVLSCTMVEASSVTVIGEGVTSTIDGSRVIVDGSRVTVVLTILFSTTVMGGGVT